MTSIIYILTSFLLIHIICQCFSINIKRLKNQSKIALSNINVQTPKTGRRKGVAQTVKHGILNLYITI